MKCPIISEQRSLEYLTEFKYKMDSLVSHVKSQMTNK